MLDPKFRSDLQVLYSDYMDPQEPTLPEIEANRPERRSRASSLDSTLSTNSLTGRLDNKLYNLRVELNDSIDFYSVGGEPEEIDEA